MTGQYNPRMPDQPAAPLAEAEIAMALPRRARAAHKGDFGHVLIVGGGVGMPGAARLAGEACLRVGAGLVTVATRVENVAAIAAGRPELICLPLAAPPMLRTLIERTDVVAIGPGLGQSDWAREVLAVTLAMDRPMILDADALNLITGDKKSLTPGPSPGGRREIIFTPHPGEAGRLLGITTEDVQRDRSKALETLVERYRCVIVLKGSGTLIGAPGKSPALCDRGNPGMATAGMGDVLTGAIAGILAQCRDPWTAARVGVLVHAMAGDRAARAGQRGLIASDVIRELRACVNV
jgi:ADP-dependent NAD(P)H-hydrate dehydratase / NAD(P)H-hydrate epimerase